MANTKRVSMTLPLDLMDDLDSVSTRLRVSRSSLISEILRSNISPIKEIIDTIPTMDNSESGELSLSRDPDKVRDYLDSFSSAIAASASDFESSKESLLATMDGPKNEH